MDMDDEYHIKYVDGDGVLELTEVEEGFDELEQLRHIDSCKVADWNYQDDSDCIEACLINEDDIEPNINSVDQISRKPKDENFDDPNLLMECVEITVMDEDEHMIGEISSADFILSGSEQTIPLTSIQDREGNIMEMQSTSLTDTSEHCEQHELDIDPCESTLLETAIEKPGPDTDVVSKLFNIIQAINMSTNNNSFGEQKMPFLYLITPKETYDALSDKTIKPTVDVERIFNAINIATGVEDPLETDMYPDLYIENVKIICHNPAIFEVHNIVLKNSDELLSMAYVVTCEDMSQKFTKLSLHLMRETCSSEIFKSKLANMMKNPSISSSEKNVENLLQTFSQSNDINNIGECLKRKQMTAEETSKKQKYLIKEFEKLVLSKEKELINLKKKYKELKEELKMLKETDVVERHSFCISGILSKYLEPDAVQFFLNQIKIAGKKCGAFRWSDEDKLFALGIMYKNQLDYNILSQHYTLPTIKTLQKFVTRIKKAETEDETENAEVKIQML